MSQEQEGPAPAGPVLVGVIGLASADAVLRQGFAEADHRGTKLVVLAAGAAPDADDECLRDEIARWSEKYPAVAVTLRLSRAIDPAVTLTAATNSCCLLLLPQATA